MNKQHLYIRVLMHRAFVMFLAVFLISDVGTAYAGENLPIIIAQQGTTQQDATRAKAEKLTQEGLKLFQIGTKKSLEEAIVKWEEALKLWEKLEEKGWQADILLIMGRVYSGFGEKQKALAYYNQALTLRRAMEDKRGEANALNNMGSVYSSLGKNQKALQFYNQALPLYRAVGHRGGEANTLSNIGAVYRNLGEKQKARKYYNQALRLYRAVEDKAGEAITHNNIGLIYSDLGEKQKALEYYNQALRLYRAVEDKAGEAITLNNIGLVYSDLGEKQKALEYYNQALSLYPTLDGNEGKANTLNNIGVVYRDLGEKQKALDKYKEALTLYRAMENKRGEAVTLNNIGLIRHSRGEKQEVLEYYNQALRLYRVVEDKAGEAITLNNIGLIHHSRGEKQEALEYYNQALSLHHAVEDKAGEAITLNNIGYVYFDLGKNQEALEYYNQALRLYRAVEGKGGEVNVLGKIARLERSRGNLETSLKQIEAAIAIVESLRKTYTNKDLQTTYFATVQGYYKFYIDLLMDLHKKNPSQEYNALALHISERSRARALIELLAQANAKISKNVDPKLIEKEQNLRLKRQAQEKILAKLVNQTSLPQDTIKQTEAEIQNIINQQKQLRAKIRAQNPERDKITNPEPLKLPQIQQQLDKDTVLLQYSLGRERSYLWLVTPTSLTSYELPKDSEIEKIASEFYKSLSRNGFSINSAQALSKILLEPVKDKLAGKRLVIVADGILQQIPFAALANPLGEEREKEEGVEGVENNNECRDVTCNVSRGGINPEPTPNKPGGKNTNYQPLMLNHEIVNLSSASTIAIQREKISDRKIAPKKIAILADPVFSTNSTNKKQVTSKQTRSIKLELERSALERSAKSLNRKYWKRLPGTAEEAKAILKLVSSKSSISAFRFDANYNWATSKNLNQYQILHFATHGFVNPDQPELSGIVLSLVNKNGKQVPGYLRLADLFEQDYPAELIVLSACETGLGKNVSGEGLVGLTRGLMYAGGARVALSLWQVSDKGTSVLMQEFYKQMLQENKTPSQALRAAQRNLWSNPEWRSPYYWAAFTFQGEWK